MAEAASPDGVEGNFKTLDKGVAKDTAIEVQDFGNSTQNGQVQSRVQNGHTDAFGDQHI